MHTSTAPSAENQGVVPEPRIEGDIRLEDLAKSKTSCRKIMPEVEKCILYNAANFCHWLDTSVQVSQQDKECKKSSGLIFNQSIRTSIAPISPAKARLSGAPNKSVSKSQNPGFGPETSTDNRVCRHLRTESQIKDMCPQASSEICC